ncbi:MAG TPA: hypothetical protein VIJ04_04010 [Xanthobacteraceae bacterium]
MRGPGDDLNLAVTQRRIGLFDRRNEFDLGLDSLFGEAAENDRSLSREIGRRDNIRNCNPHASLAFLR